MPHWFGVRSDGGEPVEIGLDGRLRFSRHWEKRRDALRCGRF